jgi:opacity protein-like surface antigen
MVEVDMVWLLSRPLVRVALLAIAAATVASGAVVAGQSTPSQCFSEGMTTEAAEKLEGVEFRPDEQQADASPFNSALVNSVGLRDTSADDWESSQRFYLSGIVGASFANLSSGGLNTASNVQNTGSFNGDLFTGGGAAGIAIDRPSGLLRWEVEGRGRALMSGETNSAFLPFAYNVRVADGWSVMSNVWRDYFFSEHLGIYGGGGIGGGGYRLSTNDSFASGYNHASAFAWQVGAGVTYQVSRRMTVDLGYRFFDLGTASTPLSLPGGTPAGGYTSVFTASELLLSVRIYEPFAALRRH